MSRSSWQRQSEFGVLAAVVSCACSGAPELSDEQAASRDEAVIGSVPQRIAADSYDRAYDSTPAGNYGAYVTECDRRHDGVDIDRSYDPSSPCSIAWTTSGEWLEYDVHSAAAQTLDISARVASNLAARHFHVSLDGVSLGDRVLPYTGSWLYQDLVYSGVALGAGQHTLRVTFDSDSINLNYLDLLPAANGSLRIESLLPSLNAVASSVEYGTLPAAFAIDLDPNTRWSSQFSDPQWIYVDLGGSKPVSRVRLSWETAASQSYEIAVSNSSQGPWTVVAATSTGDGGVDELAFTPVSARYVRMYSSARTTQWGTSLYDFSVFGPSTDPTCNVSSNPPPLLRPTLIVPDIPQKQLPASADDPQVAIEPSFSPPIVDGSQCLFNCYNGSVLDGNTLVATGANNSTVYVFVKKEDGTWSPQARLSNPEWPVPAPQADMPSNDRDRTFGLHLALREDELLISGTAENIGKVYVFRRAAAAWALKQILTVDTLSLALGPNSALVGTGEVVRAFEQGANGAYRLQTVFSAPADSAGMFGSALALDGAVALVGAPTNVNGGNGVGTAYAYERCGSSFRLVQVFNSEDTTTSSRFAERLAISDGQIAISSTLADGPNPNRPGTVELYERQGQYWQPSWLIGNPIRDDGQYRRFGSALDLKAHRLLVGYVTSYPFSPSSYELLFDVSAVPELRAALHAHDSASVQLSGSQALVDVVGWRFGSIPTVFDLTQLLEAAR